MVNLHFRSGPLKKQSVSYDRDDGELPAPCGRWEKTFSRGNRVCCGACAVKVEMFFSYRDFFIFAKIGLQR